MNVTNKQYDDMVKKASPPSPKIRNFILAFVVGGLICCLGQLFANLYTNAGLSEDQVKMAVPVTLIFLSAFTTALGWFDKLAKYAGAGTLVPITGFANAVASPAIEFKPEGHITGIGAKIFTVAGPVITFGLTASFCYGIILWMFKL